MVSAWMCCPGMVLGKSHWFPRLPVCWLGRWWRCSQNMGAIWAGTRTGMLPRFRCSPSGKAWRSEHFRAAIFPMGWPKSSRIRAATR